MMRHTQIRKLSAAALAWTIADIRCVIDIQERMVRDGFHCPKLGQYWDDLHACIGERNRRNRKAVA